jgi:DNA repair protein RecN (Recombination protein N)
VSHLRDTQQRQAELAELAGGDSGEAFTYAASLLEPLSTTPRSGQPAA